MDVTPAVQAFFFAVIVATGLLGLAGAFALGPGRKILGREFEISEEDDSSNPTTMKLRKPRRMHQQMLKADGDAKAQADIADAYRKKVANLIHDIKTQFASYRREEFKRLFGVVGNSLSLMTISFLLFIYLAPYLFGPGNSAITTPNGREFAFGDIPILTVLLDQFRNLLHLTTYSNCESPAQVYALGTSGALAGAAYQAGIVWAFVAGLKHLWWNLVTVKCARDERLAPWRTIRGLTTPLLVDRLTKEAHAALKTLAADWDWSQLAAEPFQHVTAPPSPAAD